MRSIRTVAALTLINLTALGVAPAHPASDDPDVIFYNGHVITLEAEGVVEAVAVQGDRILAVGDNAGILAMAGTSTRLVDLDGRTIVPGFVEGHSHVVGSRPGTLDEAQDLALSFGWTTLNELNYRDEGAIDELSDAADAGELRIRINVFVAYNDAFLMDDNSNGVIWHYWEDHAPVTDHDRFYRLVGIKIFVDGAQSVGRGCWAVTEPYPESYQQTDAFQDVCRGFEFGSQYVTQEQLNETVAAAQAAGYQVAMHAMGDKATDLGLNAIEHALDGQPNAAYRHQLHHNAFLRDDQFARIQALDVPTSVRGTFFVCSPQVWIDAFGVERFENATNRYFLPSLGAHAFAEGDFGWTADPYDEFTVRPINPLQNLWGMVTRKQVDRDGSICDPEPWIARHEISVEAALRMLTYEPAYAVGQEEVIGSLQAGKFADLVILDQNPFEIAPEDLKEVAVLMTMVGGAVEYCAQGSEGVCPIPVSAEQDAPGIPNAAVLEQNFPNPFRSGTTIRYTLERPGSVELTVHDVLGRLVRTLEFGNRSAGPGAVAWDVTDEYGNPVSPGAYVYRLRIGDLTTSRLMVVHP